MSVSPVSDGGAIPVHYVSDTCPVVLLQYDDLLAGRDVSSSIEQAYGPNGLGILVVRGVPDYAKLRADLLPLAHKFASLPDSVKSQYEHLESHYNFGWSHGKETLAGKPDYAKGSYYANPVHDQPFTDKALIEKFPSFCCANIWPKEHLPQLEIAFKALGSKMVEVGMLLAKHADSFVSRRCPSYSANRLHDIVRDSRTHKARLLHYFPAPELLTSKGDEINEDDFGSWCGWHNDHGSLTGLTSAMYLNAAGEEVPAPDAKAGLYCRNRKGEVVKATIPADCIAYQIGETQQVHAGGLLQATPHAVMVSSTPNISRETFAVFMEPEFTERMNIPAGRTPDETSNTSANTSLPRAVPPLGQRWNDKQDFGEFTNSTLAAYHPTENKM